jgi:hypothetical protein
MKRFESYQFVLVASVWAMLPWSIGAIVGIPFGIWAFWVLQKPEIKAAFAQNAIRKRRKAAPIPPSSNLDLEIVRLQVVGPAAGLMVTGILGVIFWSAMALVFAAKERNWWTNTSRGYYADYLPSDLGFGAVMAVLILVVIALILFGAWRLMKLQGPAWIFFAIILCMLPWSPLVVLGLPVAIWALFVVNRPAVKMAFARAALGISTAPVPTPWNLPPMEQQATGPVRRGIRSMLLGIQSLFVGSRAAPQPPPTPSLPPAGLQETGEHPR